MKKFLAAFAFLALATTANAQSYGNSSVRALLGFSSSSVNIGADYEMRHSSLYGFGGYFFLGSDQDGTGNKVVVPEVMAFGAFAPIHFVNDDMIDVYVAPGFGLAMVEYPNSTRDETTFGPTVKLGAEWKVAPTVKLGLQHFIITNWLADEIESQISYTNAAATFSF